MLRVTPKTICLFLFLLLPGCALLVRTPGPQPAEEPGRELRGVFHIHSVYSHDSKATPAMISKMARRLKLDFAVITDHNSLEARKHLIPPAGKQEPLLIIGEEISAPDGHLIALGAAEKAPRNRPSAEIIEWIRAAGGYAIAAHPVSTKNPWRNKQASAFDGIEVYNFAHSMYPVNKVILAAKMLVLPPGVFLASYQTAVPEALDYWDSLLETRRVAAFGASDAHMHLRWLGFAPENFMLYLRAVTMYLPAAEKKEEDIVRALGTGRGYLVFEARGRGHGFVFRARDGESVYQMGDSAPASDKVMLEAVLPARAEMRVIHRGEILSEAVGSSLKVPAAGPGAYRMEVYRRGKLWILSNPIYLT